MPRTCLPLLGVILFACSPAYAGGWVSYANETSVRLSVIDPAVGSADTQEKDYAVADVDQDGDDDLINVRKQGWTTGGGRRNVLFMNEGIADGHAINGVLVDRSTQYISDFLDLTNDRDVVAVDVNGDTWLDIVTATTLGGLGNPKSMTHPRVYINLGNDGGGNWLGYVYDDVDRVPTMPLEPRFCGVAAGDIDNDGDQDLYFTDYDIGPYGRGGDLNDRLWINNGLGYFTDQSTARMTATMLDSEFGASVQISDMNGDGWLDVVKSSGAPDGHVRSIYNGGNGFFNQTELTFVGAAYHNSMGYLNNDGLLDIIVSDDAVDRYFLNTGNGGDGMANFTNVTFPAATNGFGSNNYITDLDNDTHNDVIIVDVDVDIPGCTRTTHILQNQNAGFNPGFVADAGNIPQNQRTGVHDVAVIDINGDGFKDLVLGRCTGTQVWMNAPPIGIDFSYPNGLPDIVVPDAVTPFTVHVSAFGDTLDPDSAMLFMSVNDGPYVPSQLTVVSENMFQGEIPAGDCSDSFDFYIEAALEGGLSFTDPPGAPGANYSAVAAAGEEVILADSIEGDVSGWTITSDPSLTSGEWEQADPNPTLNGPNLVAPGDDATPGPGVMAFVTENGPAGQTNPSNWDVDFGPTYLVSPVVDLDGTDAFIEYQRWAESIFGGHDGLVIEVSNNGGASWVLVETVTDTANSWQPNTFLVSQYVVPTSTVRVRFSICDCANDSATEAGVDDFVVTVLCSVNCQADLDDDGQIGITDLLDLLAAWGSNPKGPPDLDGDGNVGITDLLALLAQWGPCP